VPHHCNNVPVPSADVVNEGIFKWSISLIINSLETPEDAPLPNIMELDTPVVPVAVYGPMYMLFDTVALYVEFAEL